MREEGRGRIRSGGVKRRGRARESDEVGEDREQGGMELGRGDGYIERNGSRVEKRRERSRSSPHNELVNEHLVELSPIHLVVVSSTRSNALDSSNAANLLPVPAQGKRAKQCSRPPTQPASLVRLELPPAEQWPAEVFRKDGLSVTHTPHFVCIDNDFHDLSSNYISPFESGNFSSLFFNYNI